MFKNVLVANRREIARRVIRSAKKTGIACAGRGWRRMGIGLGAITLLGMGHAVGSYTVEPKGYVVAEVEVRDAEAYARYKPLAAAAVAKYGGRYLVRGGATQGIEGAMPAGRSVVMEFPSVAAALAFEHSPEYRAAAAIRHQAAQSRVFVVAGVE
jgi:uncharacterized protein (DUF1330 family)